MSNNELIDKVVEWFDYNSWDEVVGETTFDYKAFEAFLETLKTKE